MASLIEQFKPNYTQALVQDMSSRTYERWYAKEKTYLLMRCPEKETLENYYKITNYLQSFGLKSPQVFAYEPEKGEMVVEDFGDQTFTQVLKINPDTEAKLYQMAVAVQIHLQHEANFDPKILPEFSPTFAVNELQSFIEFGFPAYGIHSENKDVSTSFNSAWEKVFFNFDPKNYGPYLRDYHVDNLLLCSHKDNNPLKAVGVIDFQDAIWGPKGGDVISLLEDARRDVHPDIKANVWDRFIKSFPKGDREEITITTHITSAARHMRIVALFLKRAKFFNDHRFFDRIPRLWQMFHVHCQLAEMQPVRHWCLKNLDFFEKKPGHA